MTSVTCEAVNPPSLSEYVFNKVDKSIPLYVPSESISAYQTANQWKDFKNIQAIPVQESLPTIYHNFTNTSQKLIRNGNVYVLRGDCTYTLTGAEVK